MATGYEGGYTRRQELVCTLQDIERYADVVLYENEIIYVINEVTGIVSAKIGDGKTGLKALPYATFFSSNIDNIEQTIDNFTSRVTANSKRLENLFAAIESTLTARVVDDEVAYAKTVPTGALPNAAVTEVGGMSYRCENLAKPNITHQWLSTATIADDGKITITCNAVGTAFCIAYKATVKAGESYYLKLYNASGISRVVFFADSKAQTGSLFGVTSEGVYTAKSDTTIYIGIYLHDNVASGTVGSCYVMLNKGTSALPYQPYFEGLRDSKVTEVESESANVYCGTKTTNHSGNGITYEWNKDEQIITITASTSAASEVFLSLEEALNIVGGEAYSISAVILADTSTVNWSIGACDSRNKYNVAGGYSCLARITSPRTYTFANDACLDMIHIFVNGSGTVKAKFKYMINKGTTALPYSPYFRETLTMPADALDGFGQGVSKDYCNKIVLDPLDGVKKYVKMVGEVDLGTLNWSIEENRYAFSTVVVARKNASIVYSHLITGLTNIYVNNYGNIVVNFETGVYTSSSALKTALSGVIVAYELSNPTETDISPYFNDDNLLPVEAGGTVTAVNEYKQAVPFSIEYTVKRAL